MKIFIMPPSNVSSQTNTVSGRAWVQPPYADDLAACRDPATNGFFLNQYFKDARAGCTQPPDSPEFLMAQAVFLALAQNPVSDASTLVEIYSLSDDAAVLEALDAHPNFPDDLR